jgi:hypothetical protein
MNFQEKLLTLEHILQEPAENYADSFKADIGLQLEGFSPEQSDKLFLRKQADADEIRNWVDTLTSRIVMHEDDEDVNEIIQDYILLG